MVQAGHIVIGNEDVIGQHHDGDVAVLLVDARHSSHPTKLDG